MKSSFVLVIVPIGWQETKAREQGEQRKEGAGREKEKRQG